MEVDRPLLTIDLTARQLMTWGDLWDALAEPCGLPSWFGRNLDAWWDTLRGDISPVVDSHSLLIEVRADGLFGSGGDGYRFVKTTNESTHARVEVVRAYLPGCNGSSA